MSNGDETEKERRVREQAMENFRRYNPPGGGGGGIRSSSYMLSMMAGLVIFTVLGSRILAELARIRRRLT